MRTAQVFGDSCQTPRPPAPTNRATRPPPAVLHPRRLNRQLHPHNAYLHELRLHRRQQNLLQAEPEVAMDAGDHNIRSQHARVLHVEYGFENPRAKWLLGCDGSGTPASRLEIFGAAAGTLLLVLLLVILLWMGIRGREEGRTQRRYTRQEGEAVSLRSGDHTGSGEAWPLIRWVENGTERFVAHVRRRRTEAPDGIKSQRRVLRRLSASLHRRVGDEEREIGGNWAARGGE